ncbi:FAD/NAD(P)-dependent oxidoreductase [Novispirillum itersonii]|uniref:FAD/NAD(P)-dependent oxidoreductase n=1 Tax=Novispirillum itersonii TaxID=189 RepID=UPI000381FF3B|nr:NAD(P)/FAD-dependent oxidoreductase [Novispirillum itersonii]
MNSPVSTPLRPVIIGAGPAGVRAAVTLAAAGLRPILIDEAARPGGQIYRQPPAGMTRPPEALYGFEAAKARAIHTALAPYAGQIEHRTDTLVWNIERGALDLMHRTADGQPVSTVLPYDSLILATGATDRILPLPGWTRPGVYTLGGAQIALKAQGCGIGQRVVFAGTGPLLYLIAYQYAKAGATVAAVLDTAPFANRIRALPGLLNCPDTLLKGLYYTAWLTLHGVPLHSGVILREVAGPEGAVSALHWRDSHGQDRETACDGIGLGYGLRSETQLADLAGCSFSFNDLHRVWLPDRDAAGRTSVTGVYVAGDGAGIAGADAAEAAGERAALALLQDRGLSVDTARITVLDRRIARFRRFSAALWTAFPVPAGWAQDLPDSMTLCRCEEITVGTLRRTVQADAPTELNRLKALSRIGMGRCQGRMCGVAAAEVLAHETGRPVSAIARLRPQPPIKPLPAATIPADTAGEATP